MKYPTYEKYKPSGIDWIGEVPDGWEKRRLKSFISKISNGQWGAEAKGDSLDWIVLRVADFSERYFTISKDLTTRNVKDIRNKLNNGDLVIEKSGGGEKQLVGRVVQFRLKDEHKYTYSNFIGRLVIKEEISKDYLFYYFKAFYECRINFKHIKQTTGIQNLDSDSLLQNEFFFLPLVEDQIKIAKYLDDKIARIDNLIEKDKKLIGLLKEERIALINKAITKGLDDNVKMKDSGIDWIGEIPEGWRIHRLKYKVDINKDNLGDNTNPGLEIAYLDISNVDNNGNLLNCENYLYEDSPSRAKRLPESGDSIISTVRTYLRAIAFLKKIPRDLVVSTGFAVLHPKDIDAKYLYYSINSEKFIQNVIANSRGIAYPAINSNDLGDLYIICPKVEAQKDIVKYLDNKVANINKIVQKIEKKVELLEEYKKSLIYNVVTGKMNV